MFTDWMCPMGWLPQKMLAGTPQEYSICAPPPLPASCPDGMMPVVGQADCQPIGDPCPAGDWPAGLPASGTIVFVQAGAVGGDGSSQAAPLGSIGAAVAAAPDGAVIAIAKGMYAEGATVSTTVTLWGACVTGVTIAGPAGAPTDATIQVNPPGDVTVRNVTVSGPRLGMAVYPGAKAAGLGIWISGATGDGIAVGDSTIDLDGVAVTETQALADGTSGWGLDVEGGAHASVKRTYFDHNRQLGIFAANKGTDITLTDVIVSNTQSQESDMQSGRGLELDSGAHATVQRAVFDHNHDTGVLTTDAGTVLTLTDAVVTGTQSQESDMLSGHGLSVQFGAHTTVERAVFDHNRDAGITAASVGTLLTLTDVVVQDTQSRESDMQFGEGLEVALSAHATVERAVFDDNRKMGVFATDAGTDLTLTDVVVQDTQSQESDMLWGRGLHVQEGAHAAAQRAVFDDNREAGVSTLSTGTVLTLIDVVVQDTQSDESAMQWGLGLSAVAGAHATVERAVFDQNRVTGIFAEAAGTSLALTDVVVHDTQSQESDKDLGRGLDVQSGAHATVERAVFDQNREFGVVVGGAGADLELHNVVVSGTLPQDLSGEFGVGVAVITGATLDVQSSRIVESRVAGLLAQNGGQVSLSSCEVLSTQAGSITLVGTDGSTFDGPHYGDVADGIEVVGSSSATLTDVRVDGCLRAGIIFDHSSGSLASVTSTENRFGLVLQGSPEPSYDKATCDFSGNQEQAVVPDGNLPVPNAPIPVPPEVP
jgi:hypothetical protein